MFAYTMSEKRGATDLVLAELAEVLAKEGWSVSGVVQINTERPHPLACDMDVKVLEGGPVIRISQSLGKDARGCRLDASALADAVGAVANSITNETDLLIINKFGKQEADGRGFRDVIATAAQMGVPVLCGVNQANRDALLAFADGSAEHVPDSVEALRDWFGARAQQA